MKEPVADLCCFCQENRSLLEPIQLIQTVANRQVAAGQNNRRPYAGAGTNTWQCQRRQPLQ